MGDTRDEVERLRRTVTFLRNCHTAVCFENGDHKDEVDTAYSLGADALEQNQALRQRAEAAEQERDTAKKYMAAYAECDRIGTEAYRDLADQHDALRAKVSDMEAAWLVAHGVDLDSAMVAVQSANAAALTARLDAEWNAAIDKAADKCEADKGRFDGPDRIRALRR